MARVPDDRAAAVPTDRILTVPNIISIARLLGVPVFLWLLLGPEEDGWAVVVLVIAGASDWVDGVIARRLNQISRLGQALDPIADRLYIAAIMVGMAIRGIVPWWLVAILASRDVALACMLPALKRRGILGLPVHYLGKAATFALLWGFPFVLLGEIGGGAGIVFGSIGWACVIWGTVLYVYSAVLYAAQARGILRTASA